MGSGLNRQQWIVILVGVAVLLPMLLVPPWRCTMSRDGSSTQVHYAPLFLPPDRVPAVDVPSYSFEVLGAKIDAARLAVQCLLVLVITGVAVAALGGTPEPRFRQWFPSKQSRGVIIMCGVILLVLLFGVFGVFNMLYRLGMEFIENM